jgi:divalent metal cation (Fe/Co/Zn/Cd) transporter
MPGDDGESSEIEATAQPTACGCHDAPSACHVGAGTETGSEQISRPREDLVTRGLRLEYLTVGWNIIEGGVSIAAALGAGSIALFGFGVDSLVETTSGLVLIWRLRAERQARDPEEIERLDQHAHKLVALSLFLLAAYIAFDAVRALITHERPEPTMVGIAITSLSLTVMWWLARAKRRTARALGSRALEADSFQTTACFWLSLVTLAGIGLNAAFGWWWADPVAALGITFFLVSEGREAWRGEDCTCVGNHDG